MDEDIFLKKPFAVGAKRPQGVEVVDADAVPIMLVYGESQREARSIAERVSKILNDSKDFP